jgi:hypothetical protein
MLAAVLRGPLIPLDLGGWLRRTVRVFPADATVFLAFGGCSG